MVVKTKGKQQLARAPRITQRIARDLMAATGVLIISVVLIATMLGVLTTGCVTMSEAHRKKDIKVRKALSECKLTTESLRKALADCETNKAINDAPMSDEDYELRGMPPPVEPGEGG